VSDGKGSVARNAAGVMPARLAGAIIAGFDVHLRQITFDCLDAKTGEVTRRRIASEPAAVREWVGQFPGRRGARRDGGLLGLAVRRSRGGALRRRTAFGRDGRHACVAGSQASRQDRPPGRAVAQRAASGGSAAGGVDRARAHSPVALQIAPTKGADRRAHPVAVADPLGALPPLKSAAGRQRESPEATAADSWTAWISPPTRASESQSRYS